MSSNQKATATKREAKPSLVPKLRFPEFRGAKGWKIGQLKDTLSSISNGLALDQGSETSGYRVTRIETISAGTIDLAKVGLIQTSDDISAYKLRVGDILLSNINSVAHIGKSVFVDREYDLYHGMNLLRLEVNRTQHNPKFIFYAINTDGIRESLRERANKAVNQASINQTELGKTEVCLPFIPEQNRIAECLSSVDELTATQARKVDALKTHKKGLMQQLFPREGEAQPRLRFPEFQNAGEWEETPLKNVFSIFQGYAFSSNDSVERGCRWLKIADVGLQLMNHEAPSFLPEDYSERFAKFSVSEGDYVIALTRPILNGQLKIAQVDNIFDGALLNQRVGKLISSQHPAFVFFLLQTCKLIADIEKSISGNDPPNLSTQQIEGIKTYVPRPREQQRIASCLSSLDVLITAETQKLEALKTHKRGLMQHLFPSPEDNE